MPKNLTVQKVAEIVSRTPKTVRNWLRKGVFPHAFKVRDGWFVPLADVKRVMKAGEP
jgi:hypothetical protein